jgi:hypothetical protein
MSEVLAGISEVMLWLKIVTEAEGLGIDPVDSVCGI